MAMLTKTGKCSLTLEGKSRLLPDSEKMPTKLEPSLAQIRHTSICGCATVGVPDEVTNGDSGDDVGTPGDAAILTPLRVN